MSPSSPVAADENDENEPVSSPSSPSAPGNASFKDVFEKIIFAVPGKHLRLFENAFQARCLEAELLSELES